MRFVPPLVLGTALLAGCTLFGDRPCEPGRYACPGPDLELPTDLGEPRVCSLDHPCTLPPVMTSAPADVAANLVAVSGRDGDAWMVGTSMTGQGVLLRAQPGQPSRLMFTLPFAGPRALTATPTGTLTLFIANLGSALYQYVPQTAMLTTLALTTGSCPGRLNPAGTIDGVLALSPSDLWLVGAPTNDAAAGLFRVRNGLCQVLPELESAGLPFASAWGAVASGPEPADRQVWTVGASGAAVRWSFQGPDGAPQAQRLAIAGGASLRAVAGGAPCPTPAGAGPNPTTCAFMISSSGLYSAAATTPEPVALPTALHAAELTSVFADSESVWLVGTLAAAGFIARYQPHTAAWSYLGGLPPTGGTLRAAWGAGDGSLWVVGDQGTVLYAAKSP